MAIVLLGAVFDLEGRIVDLTDGSLARRVRLLGAVEVAVVERRGLRVESVGAGERRRALLEVDRVDGAEGKTSALL